MTKIKQTTSLKEKIRTVIFGTETKSGKFFDIMLLALILISMVVVMLESIEDYNLKYHRTFVIAEWALTILFSIEYAVRIYISQKPKKYIFSFYGIVDFMSILPTYLSLFFLNTKYLTVIRLFRLLRVFRIFKLVSFIKGRNLILSSLKESLPKITVFLSFIITVAIIIGTTMYIIESGNPESGFVNIPISIYWSIVTLTTVGYGDISPITPLGQLLASVLMIIGYAVIAVPTGIVSIEMNKLNEKSKISNIKKCLNCGNKENEPTANYCIQCGEPLKFLENP